MESNSSKVINGIYQKFQQNKHSYHTARKPTKTRSKHKLHCSIYIFCPIYSRTYERFGLRHTYIPNIRLEAYYVQNVEC